MSLAYKAQKIWLSAAQPYAKEREETFQKKKESPERAKGATYSIKNTLINKREKREQLTISKTRFGSRSKCPINDCRGHTF